MMKEVNTDMPEDGYVIFHIVALDNNEAVGYYNPNKRLFTIKTDSELINEKFTNCNDIRGELNDFIASAVSSEGYLKCLCANLLTNGELAKELIHKYTYTSELDSFELFLDLLAGNGGLYRVSNGELNFYINYLSGEAINNVPSKILSLFIPLILPYTQELWDITSTLRQPMMDNEIDYGLLVSELLQNLELKRRFYELQVAVEADKTILGKEETNVSYQQLVTDILNELIELSNQVIEEPTIQ